MKKLIALFLAVCMVFSMGAVAQAEAVSGTFTGTAKGLGGDVTVTLTLEDGKITACTAEGANETVGIGSVVIDTFPGMVVESGSIVRHAILGENSKVCRNAVVGGAFEPNEKKKISVAGKGVVIEENAVLAPGAML